jgi:hypothetical protein
VLASLPITQPNHPEDQTVLSYILRCSARRYRQTGNVVYLSAYRDAMVCCAFLSISINLAVRKLIQKRKELCERRPKASFTKCR